METDEKLPTIPTVAWKIGAAVVMIMSALASAAAVLLSLWARLQPGEIALVITGVVVMVLGVTGGTAMFWWVNHRTTAVLTTRLDNQAKDILMLLVAIRLKDKGASLQFANGLFVDDVEIVSAYKRLIKNNRDVHPELVEQLRKMQLPAEEKVHAMPIRLTPKAASGSVRVWTPRIGIGAKSWRVAT